MKAKILIIEDVPTDAKLIELEVMKYNPNIEISITDSMEGLSAALIEFGPDVVLSDFDLRTFNGFDVLKALEVANTNIPCIIVTGVISDEETVAKLILKGAVGFIQKKDLSHIRDSLNKVLNDLNSSFSSNFETYESKLKLLFKLREMQFNFNKIAMEIPEISKFNGEFTDLTEQMIIEIENSYAKLHILKGDQK